MPTESHRHDTRGKSEVILYTDLPQTAWYNAVPEREGDAIDRSAEDKKIMEIEFSLEEADMLAFFEYHNEHSESSQAARRRNTYGYGLAFIGLGITFLVVSRQLAAYGVAFTLLGLVWMFYWPRRARYLYRKQVASLWREGRNPIFEGAHVLRLEDTSLVSTTPAAETRLPVGNIQRLVATPDHVFLYLGALEAIVVPRRRVVRGDVDMFVEQLQRHMQPVA